MIILCDTLLPNGRAHAIPADVGKKVNPIPFIDKFIDVDVAPIVTFSSVDSKIVFRVLKKLYFFFEFCLLSLKYVTVSSMSLIEVMKLFTSSDFFSNLCYKSLFSNGADR